MAKTLLKNKLVRSACETPEMIWNKKKLWKAHYYECCTLPYSLDDVKILSKEKFISITGAVKFLVIWFCFRTFYQFFVCFNSYKKRIFYSVWGTNLKKRKKNCQKTMRFKFYTMLATYFVIFYLSRHIHIFSS